jgi:hypothetical protein
MSYRLIPSPPRELRPKLDGQFLVCNPTSPRCSKVSFFVGSILQQLRVRYQKDKIYTNIGGVLVAINPFQLLPIYTSDVMARVCAQTVCGCARPLDTAHVNRMVLYRTVSHFMKATHKNQMSANRSCFFLIVLSASTKTMEREQVEQHASDVIQLKHGFSGCDPCDSARTTHL